MATAVVGEGDAVVYVTSDVAAPFFSVMTSRVPVIVIVPLGGILVGEIVAPPLALKTIVCFKRTLTFGVKPAHM